MDPLLFNIDGETTAEVLGTIVLMALFIERALSLIFEWRPLVLYFDGKGAKEPIAIIVSVAVAWAYKFDALAILFKEEKGTFWGYLLTGAIIAGGSKGAIKLFRDWFNWKSDAYRELEQAKADDVVTVRVKMKKDAPGTPVAEAVATAGLAQNAPPVAAAVVNPAKPA
jgi:hypothetical protein